jgi:hypothetical protein
VAGKGFGGETKAANTSHGRFGLVAKDGPKTSDYWAAWDGIPLCHAPSTPEEWAELEKKGACRCG